MKSVFLAATLAALALSVVEQASGAAAGTKSSKHKPAVQKSKKHPQKNSAVGVQNRKRTAGEAASLERKETGANAEERHMREDNRGRLASTNRTRLQSPQNRVSKAIDHKKHNAIVSSARPKIASAARPQQQRAAKLKTGQLTTRQAAHLETQKTSLHQPIRSDRKQLPESVEPNQQPSQTGYEIHLKEHNARMF